MKLQIGLFFSCSPKVI